MVEPFSLDFADLLVAAEGFTRKRVVCVDFENRVLLVVSEDAYAARDFRRQEQIPFTEALWL